jgi:hypothetical protein
MTPCPYCGCNSPEGGCCTQGACLARQHIIAAKQRIADVPDDDCSPPPLEIYLAISIGIIALAFILLVVLLFL